MGHFFGLSYREISGSNQVKNSFFRISNISVPCPHAQLRGGTVNKKLWTFFGPWGRDRSQSPPRCIFRVKQIYPSTASARTTRQVPAVARVCLQCACMHAVIIAWRARPISFMAGSRPMFLVTWRSCLCYWGRWIIFWVKSKEMRQRGNTILWTTLHPGKWPFKNGWLRGSPYFHLKIATRHNHSPLGHTRGYMKLGHAA